MLLSRGGPILAAVTYKLQYSLIMKHFFLMKHTYLLNNSLKTVETDQTGTVHYNQHAIRNHHISHIRSKNLFKTRQNNKKDIKLLTCIHLT